MSVDDRSRRRFVACLTGAGVAAVGFGAGTVAKTIALPQPARLDDRQDADPMIEGEETPLEDLMQEHAVLERVLLVYEAACSRLAAGLDLAPDILAHAAGIIRGYIEDHHERDEEVHVFPRLERVGVTVELIATLRLQHAAGRRLTSEVISLSTAAGLRSASDRGRLVTAIQQFIRMYRPHAARENTVLFPAFRKAVSHGEYEDLRATLERDERAALGSDPFESTLAKVRALEDVLGIGDLSSFTPIFPPNERP